MQAVVFGYTGVFTTNDSKLAFCEAFGDDHGIDVEAMQQRMIEQWSHARLSPDAAFFQPLAHEIDADPDVLESAWLDFFNERDGIYHVVDQLDCNIGLLTEQVTDWFNHVRRDDYFDATITSYDIAKPIAGPEPFYAMIEALDVYSDDCLYVNTSTKHTRQAGAVGMETHQFTDVSTLNKLF
jgi:beta-phosphoglucomutase-like phosphatase (HAD superfamily)